jgi:biopolymer transport protein ExbD
MQRPSQRPEPKNDINVTPLVDVVLVLLIIFMVITPMLQKGAPVELPLTEHPEKAQAKDEQVTVSIDKEGRVFWEQDQVDDSGMLAKLSEAISVRPNVKIFLKGDRGANYGRVRQIMKLIQGADCAECQRIGIITKEPERMGG